MSEHSLMYFSESDVDQAIRDVDVPHVVAEALLHHSRGETTLPEEAYLGWTSPSGDAARSLALPAAVWSKDRPAVGIKIINASLGNTARGIRRAQGLTLLFDPETAHPIAILEAGRISVARTVAYTLVSIDSLATSDATDFAVIGCGAIGRAHVAQIFARQPGAKFRLFDQDPESAMKTTRIAEGACTLSESAEHAVRRSDVIITTTTTTDGYVAWEWLQPGALIAHVSLDDVLPEVVEHADLVFVDDWNLVRDDSRRVLGRMYREGSLVGPETATGHSQAPGSRAVDGTLADVLSGRHPGRIEKNQIVLSNPFGMGILDVAVAARVVDRALAMGLGRKLPI